MLPMAHSLDLRTVISFLLELDVSELPLDACDFARHRRTASRPQSLSRMLVRLVISLLGDRLQAIY
jgi:hypothetical protein